MGTPLNAAVNIMLSFGEANQAPMKIDCMTSTDWRIVTVVVVVAVVVVVVVVVEDEVFRPMRLNAVSVLRQRAIPVDHGLLYNSVI